MPAASVAIMAMMTFIANKSTGLFLWADQKTGATKSWLKRVVPSVP